MEFESTQAAVTCYNCNVQLTTSDKFCMSCGFPVNGTEDEQRSYRLKVSSRKRFLEDAEKKIKEAKTIIYVLAGLTAVMGLIAGFAQDDFPTMVVNLVLCLLYVILAAWSNKNPFGAILTCFIVYLTIQILNAFIDPVTIAQGIIIKILVIAGFVKGIRSAYEAKNLIKELEGYKAI